MTIGRNQLCPCGSGKRYKSCCGRVIAQLHDPSPPRGSSYLAPNWATLGNDQIARLAALMTAALADQNAQRYLQAAQSYRAVLDAAPDTVDALHMLGTI